MSATFLTDSTIPCPLPLPLLLDRAGLDDRLAAALRFVPFDDDDFARPFEDFADVDFARLLNKAGFFAALERLVVRDALVLLRALADVLRVLAPFGLALLLVPLDFEAVRSRSASSHLNSSAWCQPSVLLL